jgi:hypothetical protein
MKICFSNILNILVEKNITQIKFFFTLIYMRFITLFIIPKFKARTTNPFVFKYPSLLNFAHSFD